MARGRQRALGRRRVGSLGLRLRDVNLRRQRPAGGPEKMGSPARQSQAGAHTCCDLTSLQSDREREASALLQNSGQQPCERPQSRR